MPTSTGKVEKSPDGKYHCPKCEKTFADPRAIGAHLSKAHGILGSSPSTVAARRAKQAAQGKVTRHKYPDFQRNAQKKFDCIAPGCHKTGANGCVNVIALKAHMKTAHSYGGAEATARFAEVGEPTEHHNGNGHRKELAHRNRMGTPLHIELPFNQTDRAHTITNELATIDEYLNYCPRCNEDLDKIKQVTGVGPSKCPGCKLNLASVRMALHPDLIRLDPNAVAQVFGVMQNIVQGGK
jgi:uncharacterized C2H2 Zn-finger protein/uncharacterized protein (UPF0212 family)